MFFKCFHHIYIPEIYFVAISEDQITTGSLFPANADGTRFDWEAFVSASRKKGWKQLGDRQKKFATLFVNRIPKKYYGGTRKTATTSKMIKKYLENFAFAVKDYHSLYSGKIDYVEIFKNPDLGELKECGAGARGIIFKNDLYMLQHSDKLIHKDIPRIFSQNGIDVDDSSVNVVREGEKKIKLSVGYDSYDDQSHETKQHFREIFNKCAEKNKGLIFVPQVVGHQDPK